MVGFVMIGGMWGVGSRWLVLDGRQRFRKPDVQTSILLFALISIRYLTKSGQNMGTLSKCVQYFDLRFS